ncbi:glutathione S-transferase family protein [Xanthobacter aminoxidans]|uniref:glutathione S-transferase family protein n=1 Tax=Xanthobacter aminoxidans TaxID=186280 RepID=UPI00202308AD|nr:glutathione S-transferase family protein [Xanthobacter aminoxidans]MCL8381047.1 glutathione S-transferase family protein [Xanthobacter aminoxidans]
MTADDTVTLFFSPNTRASCALTLLEELGAPYRLHVLNMKAGEQRQPPYLAINPMGKVPAILHRVELVTEQVAIFIHLADAFPKAGFAPALGAPGRGPYLRWLVYYAACYEPALADRALKRDPGPASMSPYGDFDTMLDTVSRELASKPYLLGDRCTAVDILWGNAFHWGVMFKLVPETPVIADYVRRITGRPAALKVAELDARLAAEHQAAVDAATPG